MVISEAEANRSWLRDRGHGTNAPTDVEELWVEVRTLRSRLNELERAYMALQTFIMSHGHLKHGHDGGPVDLR
jgi:hypothetical protein